jgi:hypothetical protein
MDNATLEVRLYELNELCSVTKDNILKSREKLREKVLDRVLKELQGDRG